ncbi:MAG: hypothetical protein V4590_09830 [Bacteroidota bacterium]
MKSKLLCILFFACSYISYAQTYRGQSLAGVDGLVGFSTQRVFHLPVNIGGFVARNLAIGFAGNYGANRGTSGNIKSSTQIGVGAFTRYYLLPARFKQNLFFHSTYQYNFVENTYRWYNRSGAEYKENTKSESVMLALGASFMIASDVSLEVMAGYDVLNSNGSQALLFGGGFQFHIGEKRIKDSAKP